MPKKKTEEVTGDGQPARDMSDATPLDSPATNACPPSAPGIYAAISRVMQDIGAVGKNQRNEAQNYKFRGIDDIYASAQLVCAKYGVVVVPSVLSTEWAEVQTRNNTTMRHLKALIRYTFYAADGSSVEAITLGEAMDSGDKSSYKALAGASKYALLQVFMIPTSEPKDPENDSPETVAAALPASVVKPAVEPATAEETTLYLSIIENSKAQLPLNQLRADLLKRFGTRENVPPAILEAWGAKNKALAANGSAKP